MLLYLLHTYTSSKHEDMTWLCPVIRQCIWPLWAVFMQLCCVPWECETKTREAGWRQNMQQCSDQCLFIHDSTCQSPCCNQPSSLSGLSACSCFYCSCTHVPLICFLPAGCVQKLKATLVQHWRSLRPTLKEQHMPMSRVHYTNRVTVGFNSTVTFNST